MRDSRKMYGRRALIRLFALASFVSYRAGFWAELAETEKQLRRMTRERPEA